MNTFRLFDISLSTYVATTYISYIPISILMNIRSYTIASYLCTFTNL